MRFRVNEDLLPRARQVLSGRGKLYWIIGGACAGKSTVCRAISAMSGVRIYDVDAHIFEDYPNRCTAERHPALKAWFSAPHPFAWMLGLSEQEFQEFNWASTAEYLDLIADEVAAIPPGEGMLIDGGISSAAVLARVVPSKQVVCLATSEATSVRTWEESADRAFMKEMVYQLPDPENAWQKFLRFDTLITRSLLDECRANGIRVIGRDENTAADEYARVIAEALGTMRDQTDQGWS